MGDRSHMLAIDRLGRSINVKHCHSDGTVSHTWSIGRKGVTPEGSIGWRGEEVDE